MRVSQGSPGAATISPIERVGMFLLKRILAKLTIGRLKVITPSGATLTRTDHDSGSPSAVLIIHRWRMLVSLLRHGDIGFADSYLDGDWSSPDIAALIELAARNRAALDDTIDGTWLKRCVDRVFHLRRANTRAGSKRNIVAHYDLGNAFYAHWLDSSMCYSSALYACDATVGVTADVMVDVTVKRALDPRDTTDTLEDAQARKLDAIVAQLDLKGGERILEIGCGWGALALRLAEAGCHVTAVTLSPAQHTAAVARIFAAGFAEQVDIRLQDYRDIDGQFDRIVSIEMFEAVGEAYWPLYFARLHALLKPNGIALLQVITIDEKRFDAYRKDVDFIQRHVFPGGMLPTPTIIGSLCAQAGLHLAETRTFGKSYALTLAEWHRRFQHAWPSLQGQGFDERFKRLWEYYLTYCEGGFAAGAIDVGFYRMHSVV